MDRGAWRATVHGVARVKSPSLGLYSPRVRHDCATEHSDKCFYWKKVNKMNKQWQNSEGCILGVHGALKLTWFKDPRFRFPGQLNLKAFFKFIYKIFVIHGRVLHMTVHVLITPNSIHARKVSHIRSTWPGWLPSAASRDGCLPTGGQSWVLVQLVERSKGPMPQPAGRQCMS